MLFRSSERNSKFIQNKFFNINQNISARLIYKVVVMSDVVFIFVMWGANIDQLIYKDKCNNHHPHIFCLHVKF
jgi:hypothetical protein